jgi:Na+/H+ antiporter NhaD/arsenite permease-like protein
MAGRALLAGVAVTITPWRIPPAVMAAAVTVAAIGVGVVPFDTVGDALDVLGSPLAFLLVAVPLAVVLDDLGFFASAAAFVDGGRHLRLGLWVMAIGVTILFNLDAAVVLLTPLYVRLAVRHGEDPVALAFIPALVASLASSVLIALTEIPQVCWGAGIGPPSGGVGMQTVGQVDDRCHRAWAYFEIHRTWSRWTGTGLR